MVNMVSAGVGVLGLAFGVVLLGLTGSYWHDQFDPPRWDQRAPNPNNPNDIVEASKCAGQDTRDCSTDGKVAAYNWQFNSRDTFGAAGQAAGSMHYYGLTFACGLMISGLLAAVGGVMEDKVSRGVIQAAFWFTLVFGFLAFGYACQAVNLTKCDEGALFPSCAPAVGACDDVVSDNNVIYTCQCAVLPAIAESGIRNQDPDKTPSTADLAAYADAIAKRDSYSCDIGSRVHAVEAFCIIGLFVNVLCILATTCVGGDSASAGGATAKQASV